MSDTRLSKWKMSCGQLLECGVAKVAGLIGDHEESTEKAGENGTKGLRELQGK